MLRFWRNPEFVRHVRADLRPPRAFTAAVLVLVICALVGLSCWATQHKNSQEFFRLFHYWLIGIQFIVLGIWCAYACGQAISRERAFKAYDFLRTTRLTSAEIMVGKILGTPILAYFVVGCSLPIAVVTGILGGNPIRVLVWVYVLMLVFAFFISLIALWGSMLAERIVGGVIWVFLLLWMVQALSFTRGPFPGVAAVTLLPSVLSLYRANTYIARGVATFFGIWVPMEFLTVLLYVLLGVWIVLMLVRNLKKERDQIRLLSRWQAVGFAAFLNVLFYALLEPGYLSSTAGGVPVLTPRDLSKIAVVFNAVIFLMIGLATLTPHEKLKAWWRRRAAREEPYFSEYGLPWPWLVPSAVIAYGLLAGEAFGLRRVVPIHRWQLGAAAVQLLVFLLFTMRDILFLQWCALTRMKRPLVKGFLYL